MTIHMVANIKTRTILQVYFNMSPFFVVPGRQIKAAPSKNLRLVPVCQFHGSTRRF